MEGIIYNGDCLVYLQNLLDKSAQLIFADPPYNISGKTFNTVQSGKLVTCDKGNWDKFANDDEYLEFSLAWISECKRILKDNGTIWITGTHHNYPLIWLALRKLNMYIVNDLIWYKPNATPLIMANRLNESFELIWIASKSKDYYFNYEIAKTFNKNKQLKNLWVLNAKKHLTEHPTEKPEELIERIVLIGSNKGDMVVDPFGGSGTTGVICKRYDRKFTLIEKEKDFYNIAIKRIDETKVEPFMKLKSKKLLGN